MAAEADKIHTDIDSTRSRFTLAYAWLAGLAIYGVAIYIANNAVQVWINDLAWTVAAAAATYFCFCTSRQVEQERRRAWSTIALACGSWLIGQLHWNYVQLVLKVAQPFPSVNQIFYTGFALLVVAGVMMLPEARHREPFTLKHVGNLGLVTCCLAITVVLGMLEPALQNQSVTGTFLWLGVAHTVLVAGTFLSTLSALWTFRWGSSWTPMLLLVFATSIYAISNFVYAHALLTQSYLADDLVNVSWLAMFGLLAAAAYEQAWLSKREPGDIRQRMQTRERWLEAVMPALLIVIMVAVALSSTATLTPRVIWLSASIFILFAVILGAREAWIQNESQQLTDQLVTANQQLQDANVELRHSEARYRELTTVLEQRVGERTTELKRAYEELEGFSYAVAHDLKAPLRAINGFAHLFEQELQGQLTDRAREHLSRIRNGSLKMSTLIDDLLSYSHIDRRGMQASVVSLPSLVDQVLSPYQDEVQRRGIVLTVVVEPMTVRVDASGLALALRNLVENALKYTRDTKSPRVAVVCRRKDGGVSLAVTDNGIGFDMQYHDHIFKLFQRLHRDDQYPGTGIGLALVRKAVERLGGRVYAQSKPGEGATFTIELPG
ncbi:MAG TPA: ATP-binding protein [Steroidobacter sp.]|uniref:sensor histidine kinase n=1 Tax=Steroidobacter sp. TaxID=1978227 RepID=UPI002EDB5FF7